MKINSEFSDLLRSLNAESARYLIVGAHAVNYYGRPRATIDFDIWIDRGRENATRVYRALAVFGAPLDRLSVDELTSDDLIFQIGVAPIRIDILTDVSGLAFAEAWPNRSEDAIDGVVAFFIGRDDLIKNKRATGRPKDVADVERLEHDR